MHNYLFSAPRLFVFAFFVFSILLTSTSAQNFQPFALAPTAAGNFTNPVLKMPNAGCAADNLRGEQFASEIAASERVELCRAINKITNKLNRTVWSPALAAELRDIWQTFSNEQVTLRLMPKDAPSRALAMAEPFPDKTSGVFAAAVYVRPEKSDDAAFFQILFHELRHVYDFHETWRNKTALDSLEIERRAYLLMGKLTQETPERERFSGVPKFWKESWRSRSEDEISARRLKAVEKYLRGKKLYRDLARDPIRRTLDFSRLKTTAKTVDNRQAAENRQPSGEYDRRTGEPLPRHKALPQTAAVLPQNIRAAKFNLEKPKNPRDEKEILRVALSNEKKLYYGMSNFVYDQKLAFQCLKKGRVSASFTENNTVARTGDGDALFKLAAAPAALPCILNYDDLKTDFTDTFWASPALEKMPMYFSGFHEVDGVTLAHYTVTQPDEQLFAELAAEYPRIRPFRVVVGTIYVSPEDGQIVRFAGTSYPEENVTGAYAQKVRCTYWVKAVRQKLNVEDGLWVTVHVGTVAVASVQGKIHPFNYTVKFENYRQSETGVNVLDDEEEVVAELSR
jgi:hypothetical protein